ncbi:MAG: hypothetical protein AAF993_05190, partial [Pseudomonadota bacterium]
QKDVFVTPEDIGKAKALGLVEPFYPRRLKRDTEVNRLGYLAPRRALDDLFTVGRFDPKDLNGLNAARGFLNDDFDARAVGDRR